MQVVGNSYNSQPTFSTVFNTDVEIIGVSAFVRLFSDWPNGLCIDAETQKIFWADAWLDKIETSDLNGQNRMLLVSDVPHPFSLAVVSPCFLIQFEVLS